MDSSLLFEADQASGQPSQIEDNIMAWNLFITTLQQKAISGTSKIFQSLLTNY